MTSARMRLAAILLVIHVVHGLGYGYTEPRTSWVGWTAESYYTAVRWLLLTVLLLLATHLFSVLYLQWAVGSDTEEARDSVPIVLCALSQSVAWAQALMLLLRVSGLLESEAEASTGRLWSGSLQSIAAACLWALTPFAYLYHEAVGVGQFFGATGIAGRATEAFAVMGMLAVLLRGFVFVLEHTLLPAGDDDLGIAAGGGGSEGTLDRLLSHLGMLALLLAVRPRCPPRPPSPPLALPSASVYTSFLHARPPPAPPPPGAAGRVARAPARRRAPRTHQLGAQPVLRLCCGRRPRRREAAALVVAAAPPPAHPRRRHGRRAAGVWRARP